MRTTYKFQMKPLNKDLFHSLFNIIHVTIFRGNFSATSRALSVTIVTARKYQDSPPRAWWWNETLIFIIKTLHHEMIDSSNKKIRIRARKALTELATFKPEEAEYLEWNSSRYEGAVKHLLMVLTQRQDKGINTKKLRLPAFSGGYSMRALRNAATVLQLDKETTGYGENKVTHYYLPRPL